MGYNWAEEVNQELERHRQPCLPGAEVSSQLLGPCGLQLSIGPCFTKALGTVSACQLGAGTPVTLWLPEASFRSF